MNNKGKEIQKLFNSRYQILLANTLYGTDDFKLRDFINGINVIVTFLFLLILIALVNGFKSNKAGFTIG